MNARQFKAMSQAEVAQVLGVDRTTIRAWTEDGMPYVAPKGRGHEGTYNGSVALYWCIGVRRRMNGDDLPKVEPIKFLALSYVATTLNHTDDDRNMKVRVAEAVKLFPGMAPEHFTREQHLNALNYALGYYDALDQKQSSRGRRR